MMNNSLDVRWLVNPAYNYFKHSPLPAILFTLAVAGSVPLPAQYENIPAGKKEEPTFAGRPGQALCEMYAGFDCAMQIGTGTTFPKSSLIGASVTGNVCIVGDFEVDVPFTFQDAVVKINPGVEIAITGRPNGFDGGGWLSINNSKLFACNALWKGITLGPLATISTAGNSVIEDAETAIYASGPTTLYIQQTTFNRNRTGIHLITPAPGIGVTGPLLLTFAGNRFTCNAPLNGTTDDITEAGVKLQDAYLYAFQSNGNRFTDLKYGVYAEGNATHIGASRFNMQRIRKDGIFMEHGSIKLTQSQFNNCEGNGIHIGSAQIVDITHTSINLNTSLPDIANIFRNGIYIGGFGLHADVRLDISFSAIVPNTQYQVRGIHLNGGTGNVGAGTHIMISESNFSFRAYASTGIYINNMFPESSDIQIFNNKFDCATYVGTNTYGNGIEAKGEMNNLHIYGNQFNTGAYASVSNGIYLQGSDGVNNQVTDNRFYPDPNTIAFEFLWLNDFQNTKICSNIGGSLGASRGYDFWGTNTGTDFAGNEIYAMGEGLEIFNNSLIGPQNNQGNKWFPINFPGLIYRSVHHAIALPGADPALSKFLVHTPQSVFSTLPGGIGYYSYFSAYHPENVTPDITNDFFAVDPAGLPSTACITRLTDAGNADGLDLLIAADQFPGSIAPQPYQGWIGKRFLYGKLHRYPDYAAANPAFTSFLSSNSNSTVSRFHAVERKIEATIAGSETLRHAAKDLIGQRLAQFGLMANMDAQMEATTDPDKLAPLFQQKKRLLTEVWQMQQQYTAVSNTYWLESLPGFSEALRMNQCIPTTQGDESNEKTINRIMLENIIHKADGLNDMQLIEVQDVATQSPASGGMNVWRALAMLNDGEKSSLALNLPQPTMPPAPLAIREEEQVRSDQQNNVDQITMLPNPTYGTFLVQLPDNTSGSMYLLDHTGKLIYEKVINGPQETGETSQLESGIYLVKFILDNGTSTIKRLIVAK